MRQQAALVLGYYSGGFLAAVLKGKKAHISNSGRFFISGYDKYSAHNSSSTNEYLDKFMLPYYFCASEWFLPQNHNP